MVSSVGFPEANDSHKRFINAMSFFTNSELKMWAVSPTLPSSSMTDDEIDEKYESREWRIITETNREQLPNFVEALKRPGWLELRPFYQRRLRWDEVRQSKLIESFVMNIPVPPFFLYESDLAKYEVMDGQQRITAIQEFYSNNLRLKGLEQWPELNGRTYSKLPLSIRRGIDRRSISYIVLLKESAETSEDQLQIRRMVFERLNTGGVELSRQEIRNSLFQGKLNELLLELSTNSTFRSVWNLPQFSPTEDKNPSQDLLKNAFYSKMNDAEVILRFFALRHARYYQRGMQGFLDLYMMKCRNMDIEDIGNLKDLFLATLDLGFCIYGPLLFRPWNETSGWAKNPQIAFADAVMVGLCRNLDKAYILQAKKEAVIEGTKNLFVNHENGTFTGRGNSKTDVNERIDLFDKMLRGVVAE